MEFDVFVEIPRNTRNKYEWDPVKKRIRLDRMLFTSTGYPYDYGFVPDTLAQDGEAIDAMVLLDEPTYPGIMIRSRLVAVYWMLDEGIPDAKLVCVPATDPRAEHIRDVHHIPTYVRDEIGHFFEIYKQLEKVQIDDPDKVTQGLHWDDRAGAEKVLRESRERWAASQAAE